MRTAYRLAWLLALGSLAFSAAASAATTTKPPSKIFPYPMKIDRLPNGMTIVRVPFNSPGLIAYYTVMRVGSRNEVEPGRSGFAHFFEHMMFKGTPSNPEGAREKILNSVGFDDNAFTTNDVTIFHSYGPSSALPQLVAVEADRFQHLAYSEPSFQTEAKAVLGEYHKGASNPDQKLEEVLAATAFTTHTYRHTTIGFYDDVKAMPAEYEYSKQFFQRWYTPDNAMLFVVGEFDDAKLMADIRKAYGSWKGKSAQVAIPPEPPQTLARSAHIDWNGPTLSRHVVAWHTPSADPARMDGAIQNVLAAYLVGPTSPLYKELVLEQQLVETIGSGYNDHRDPNLFSILAVLKDEKNRPAVAQAIDAAVAELASGKVDVPRVAAIRSNLRYGLLMSLETADDVAVQLAYYAGVLGSPDALEHTYANVEKVQPIQLVDFAKKYLTNQNRTVITLSSKAGGAK